MGRKHGSKQAVTRGKSIGGSTGAMEYTRGYKKRLREARKAEEEYWASLSGPVLVTTIKERMEQAGIK
jgi:hypothetical protein